MKKILVAAIALAFVFTTVNAYACGEKTNAAKAKATKAKAEMTSNDNGSCHSATEAQKADAGSKAPSAKVMTTEAHKIGDAASCPYMKDADAKVHKADAGNCCDGKTTKATDASQKAEVKQENKKADDPVQITDVPTSGAINQ